MDWFITDHLGSTKLLIDQNGQHRFTGDDDPFGINLRSFGDKDTLRYTGQILDEEQGVYYYGARYYLPEIGRFLSGDPLKEFASIYVYVGNNPVAKIDPTGMAGEEPSNANQIVFNLPDKPITADAAARIEVTKNAVRGLEKALKVQNSSPNPNGWASQESINKVFSVSKNVSVLINHGSYNDMANADGTAGPAVFGPMIGPKVDGAHQLGTFPSEGNSRLTVLLVCHSKEAIDQSKTTFNGIAVVADGRIDLGYAVGTLTWAVSQGKGPEGTAKLFVNHYNKNIAPKLEKGMQGTLTLLKSSKE